jgi:PKD repeat protein
MQRPLNLEWPFAFGLGLVIRDVLASGDAAVFFKHRTQLLKITSMISNMNNSLIEQLLQIDSYALFQLILFWKRRKNGNCNIICRPTEAVNPRSIMNLKRNLIHIILLGSMLVISSQKLLGGTWATLSRTAPESINTMLLLSDGTVMAADANTETNWYRLTPDNTGSYVNGTWSALSPMHNTRLYYSSDVLTDGRVLVAGGEYGTGTTNSEVYDPFYNAWTTVTVPTGLITMDNKPNSKTGQNSAGFMDSISKVLPNGNVLVSPVYPVAYGGTTIFNATLNTWSAGPRLYRGDWQDEASWVKLPDDSILTIDPYGTNSERYIPSLNQWINDDNVPVPIYDTYGDEMGPGFLLSSGQAIFFGGTGNTAIYTPSGNTSMGSWQVGPVIPNAQGMVDAPGAMMFNGKILCAVGPLGTSSTNEYISPTSFYEYDPVANAFTQVSGPTGVTFPSATYPMRMLDLPDGNVLLATSGSQLYVYQPGGSPLASGQPAITDISTNANGSFHLTGTLLNGNSQGAAYGDDAQMDSNYPLIRMTNLTSGVVYYARTINWSSTSVMTGNTPESTDFSLPTSAPGGAYSLVVVANGNSSDPISFEYTPDPLQIAPLNGFTTSGRIGGPFTVTSQTFTLTNDGSSPLSWSVINTSLWLTVSPASGTLNPGGPATNVIVSLNTGAYGLVAATYTTVIWFTNLSSGVVRGIPLSLQVNPLVNPLVQNGGFESGNFTNWTFSGTTGNSAIGTVGGYTSENEMQDTLFIHSGSYAALLGENSAIGLISQTVPTVAGKTYLLSLWLDNPESSVTNEFYVSWNGAIVFDSKNTGSFSFTNLQIFVTAYNASSFLEFGFRNDTNFFGLDDVTLTTAILPAFSNITASPTDGLVPLAVQFTSPAVDSGRNAITQWNWNFGDGSTSTNQNPLYIYTSIGNFPPSLIAINNLGVTFLGSGPAITVSAPTVQFAASSTNGIVPLTVQFTSSSIDSGGNPITQWNWNFGDGSTSTLQIPTHVYTSGGTFNPSLIATNNLGYMVLGSGPAITAAYLVLNGGFETGDFTGWTLSGDNYWTVVDDGFESGITPHSGNYEAALGSASSFGYLSQTVATTPGTSYLLSFWLNHSGGDPSDIFIVSWNGTTLLDETNPPAPTWTNLEFMVSATGASTPLQFGFVADGADYLDLDDVSVVAIPPPAQPGITGISLSGSNLVINGTNGVSGQTYYVLTTTNLALPRSQWLPVATNVLNSSGNFTITATNSVNINAPQQFYQLQIP